MAFIPRTQVPVSKVEIRISASNLIDRDLTSKSDPCTVMYMKDSKDGHYREFGRTENIKNCLNPQFTKSFEVDYYFEEVQRLKFKIYDIDNSTIQLEDDDYLGGMECTLGEIVSNSPHTTPLYSKSGTHAGKGLITIHAEEVQGINDIFQLQFSAKDLDKKDFLSKSDPYLEFQRQAPSGQWQVVHRTEVVKNNLSPTWRPVVVKSQKLCCGDFNRPIKVFVYDWDENDDNDLIGEFTTTVNDLRAAVDSQIDCYDYDNDGSHDFIGTFTATVAEMMKAVDGKIQWDCINPKKKAKKSSYKNSGVVILSSCKVTREYSFLDFIFGGLQLNFTVGIDFTASNGDPRAPNSLHYINPYQPNEYLAALHSVGEVIQDYDSDKLFPALGFGAKVPPNNYVSHEFALNFNPSNPFCAGIHGIAEAYKACIGQIQLYGPTNFSPIINHVAKFAGAAQQEPGAKSYFVLLILTDGVISDMNETRSAIVRASYLPMSLIIVGVGRADFGAMDMLDGDNGVLRDPQGHSCQRDIVQFVPMRDFQNANPAELAKHVLAEVPRQVTDYYRIRNIVPNAPPAAAGQAAAPGPPPPGV